MLKIGDKSVLKDGRAFEVVSSKLNICDGCLLAGENLTRCGRSLCKEDRTEEGNVGCSYDSFILIATDSPKQYTSLAQVQEEIKAYTKKIEELSQVMLDLAMSEDNEDD